MSKVLGCYCVLLVIFCVKIVAQQYQFINPIRFPFSSVGNPYVGTFVAIALPIDIRGPADLFFSANFESSYGLPENQSLLTYPPIFSSTRGFFYKLLETKINGPSSSVKEDAIDDYIESEEFGRKKGHCKKYIKQCPLSILNLFSKVKNYV
ncbi:unnamed protein product [Psylliodes chrysocephalus]|uniref:Uncharacterized protein n=1 Tax=Psylliodes chrysocephalus TaxID=3402493 RepID=A0A9P0GHU2_9CUCU|nr:unnamed protein product [Psylliodes chrysocephala]